jgi:hypothetical protein
LDFVFNHTAEGNERGPTHSFRGIDNAIYYLIDPETGVYRDYTGCGNTLNCNHPRVRDLIIDVLRYCVAEMHVDGFRFDPSQAAAGGVSWIRRWLLPTISQSSAPKKYWSISIVMPSARVPRWC